MAAFDIGGSSSSAFVPRFLVHAASAQALLSGEGQHKITNAPLVDMTRGCHACGHVALRRGLMETQDYTIVDARWWSTLQCTYGVDYEIRRFNAVQSTVATAPLAAPIKPEGVTAGQAMAPAKKKQKKKLATAMAPATPSTTMPRSLDLYPPETELFYWHDAQATAVACCHPCGHALRLAGALGTYSSIITAELARTAIATHVPLHPATFQWLAVKGVRHGVDVLVWHFSLRTWVLWRSHSAAHRLPTAAETVRSPTTGASWLCLRKRLTPDELAAHTAAVEAAQATARATTKSKSKAKGKGKRDAKTKATERQLRPRAAATKTLGKRRRQHKEDDETKGGDDEDEDEEEQRDEAEDEAEEEEEADQRATHGAGGRTISSTGSSSPRDESAAAAMSEDDAPGSVSSRSEATTRDTGTSSQETVETQPVGRGRIDEAASNNTMATLVRVLNDLRATVDELMTRGLAGRTTSNE